MPQIISRLTQPSAVAHACNPSSSGEGWGWRMAVFCLSSIGPQCGITARKGYFKNVLFIWMWWRLPVISRLGRLRQEDLGKFMATLDCLDYFWDCLKKTQKTLTSAANWKGNSPGPASRSVYFLPVCKLWGLFLKNSAHFGSSGISSVQLRCQGQKLSAWAFEKVVSHLSPFWLEGLLCTETNGFTRSRGLFNVYFHLFSILISKIVWKPAWNPGQS